MSSSHSVTSKADQLRAELNLKNLKRHDNTIDKIIASTPYVTVYYNTGQEWVRCRALCCTAPAVGLVVV